MLEPTTPAEKRQWTLMFYFASDNPLAPGIVSQLKALKNAGFHPQVNVIAQFDPFTPGTPTHIFDVNLVEKIREAGARKPPKAQIGFIGNDVTDPFIKNLMEDKLWNHQKSRPENGIPGKEIRELISESLRKQNIESYHPAFPPNGKTAPSKNLGTDMTLGNTRTRKNGSAEGRSEEAGSEEAGPRESLTDFLEFCRTAYPAEHYMLFILGHGLVVGNDIFLFDEHADQANSLTLLELQQILSDFKGKILGDQFELLSFHSCSMSSAEVAFQLQDTANYMLASQSPAFVGTWPYHQILIRIFNDVEKLIKKGKPETEAKQIRKMITNIAHYCFHNSADFILAGYSFDIALCSLADIARIEAPIKNLVRKLREGLTNGTVKNFILLAHLRSQSYWRESHTDLYDFCFCLIRIIVDFQNMLKEEGLTDGRGEELTDEGKPSPDPYAPENIESLVPKKLGDLLRDIMNACRDVRDILEQAKKGKTMPVMLSRTAGPEYQYGHGLSVFFPWVEPLKDCPILREYKDYAFQKQTSWLDFLNDYFRETMRDTRKEEEAQAVSDRIDKGPLPEPQSDEEKLFEDIANLVYSESGQLSAVGSMERLDNDTGKPTPRDSTGEESGVFIKNFPRDTRERFERKQVANARPWSVGKRILEEEKTNRRL